MVKLCSLKQYCPLKTAKQKQMNKKPRLRSFLQRCAIQVKPLLSISSQCPEDIQDCAYINRVQPEVRLGTLIVTQIIKIQLKENYS